MPLCERCNETLKPKASYCGRCGLSTTPEPVREEVSDTASEDKTSVTGWIVAIVFITPIALFLIMSGLAWIGAPGLLIVYGIRWVASKEK